MKEFLSQEQRRVLRAQQRSEKNGRTRDRIKAVILSDQGWTFKNIAEALLIDEETVSHHVSEYIDDNKLSIQTGGSVSKLDPDQTVESVAHLTKITYMKVSDICVHVSETYFD
jgi:Putative ATPase subunit of terminase (gpP-like)